MKRLVLFVAFICFCLTGYSQVKTVYYDEQDRPISDSTQAASYAIYGKLSGDSLYTFKKYDADGYVMVTGSFRDDSLKVAQGKFVYYDWVDELTTLNNTLPTAEGRDRYILVTGNFKEGKKSGKWYTFYPNGSLKNVMTFVEDVMNGEYKYFDSKGKLQISGTYLNGKKNGQWVLSGGRKIEQYSNDKVLSTVKKSKKELEDEQKQGKKLP
jgi:antitoxin component YwqK of YwqJK toxin-antitoxin module